MSDNSMAISSNRAIAPSGNDILSRWSQHMAGQVAAGQISADTSTTYQRGLHKFQEWGRARIDSGATPDQRAILDWVADLRSADNSSAAINVWLTGVRRFFQWAVAEGLASVDPTTGVKAGRRSGSSKTHKRAALADDEVARLFSLELSKRDRALLWLLAYTGARGIELHRADIEDLRTLDGEIVLYVQGKGRDDKAEFVVVAEPEAKAAVYDYLAERGDKAGPLFATEWKYGNERRRLSRRRLREIVKDIYRRAGIFDDRKTLHSLRKTAITSAIRNGALIQDAQAMARHANMATTSIYYQHENRLQNAAEKLIRYKGVE